VKQVWDILPAVLAQDQNVVNCQPLLKWLRVTSHGTVIRNAQGQPAVGSPVTAITLLAPAADKDLLSHRSLALKTALTGLGQHPLGLEAALAQMAAAVAEQMNDQRLNREARAAEANQPSLPSAKFKNTLPILMEFAQVQDELELPPLWHQWANATKCQEFSILRELLETYSRSPEAFYYLAPIVSAKLVQDLLTFTFIGDSQDDIKTGLQPFVVADGSEENRRANMELSRIHGLLNNSEHGLRTCPFKLSTVFTPGSTNAVADFCSRSFALSDTELLDHLRHRFPSKRSWQLAPPTSELLSNVSSALFRRMLPWVSQHLEPTPLTRPGMSGMPSAGISTRTLSSKTSTIPSHCFKSLPDDIERAYWLPAVLQCVAKQWKAPFMPLARRWPHWDSPTHACSHPEN
jgi:hypothetical protein